VWVEVVPKGSEYDLVMHDGGEDIALATCHTDEGDAAILAMAVRAYEVLYQCKGVLATVKWYLQGRQGRRDYEQLDAYNAGMAGDLIDDLTIVIERVFQRKSESEAD